MRLKHFNVTGLYGLFNHDIPLNIEDRISIIHAPNGFGKTVILKFISGFFGGSMNVFREVEFKKVIFELLAFGFEDLKQSSIFNDIRTWEVSNAPRKCLRAA